jgi:hypothetical protein
VRWVLDSGWGEGEWMHHRPCGLHGVIILALLCDANELSVVLRPWDRKQGGHATCRRCGSPDLEESHGLAWFGNTVAIVFPLTAIGNQREQLGEGIV